MLQGCRVREATADYAQSVISTLTNHGRLETQSQPLPDKPTYLRLVVPASQSDVNLCKTLLSAAALNYPTPILINWQKTYDDPNLTAGGSHIAKIGGVLDYLKSLSPQMDEGLVVLIDGYDVWFQLRPSVLIERYYDINKRANARIRRQMGKAMDIEGISQNVIFSSQKRCWPKDEDHSACFAVPESSLPKDAYGPQTDQDVGDEKNPYVKYRPRYLNSGSAVGPVAALRAIFERAHEKAQNDSNIGSDQGIFAEIFGEQEFQREFIRLLHRTWWGKLQDWSNGMLGRYYSFVDPATAGSHQLMDYYPGTPFEFGLGLDYGSQIAQATVFSEYDTEWIRHDDQDRIRHISSELGIPPQRVMSLPNDIRNSTSPFKTLRGTRRTSGNLPSDIGWDGIPLFTNMWTGTVPAAVHHNAHRDGLKARRETHWNRTWYQPYARPLLEAHVLQPAQPVATAYINGNEREWWSESNEKGGVKIFDSYEWIPFQDLCEQKKEDVFDIFRDDEEPWTDPWHSPDWSV